MESKQNYEEWSQITLPIEREQRILARIRAAANESDGHLMHRSRWNYRRTLSLATASVMAIAVIFSVPQLKQASTVLRSRIMGDSPQFPVFVPPAGMWRAFEVQSDDLRLTAIGYTDDVHHALLGSATTVYVTSEGRLLYQYKLGSGLIAQPTWLNNHDHYSLLIPCRSTDSSDTKSLVHAVEIDATAASSWNIQDQVVKDITYDGLSIHKFDSQEVLFQGRYLGDSTPTWYVFKTPQLQILPVKQAAHADKGVHLYHVHVVTGLPGAKPVRLESKDEPVHMRIGEVLALQTDNLTVPIRVTPGTGDNMGIPLPSPYKDALLYRFNQPYKGTLQLTIAGSRDADNGNTATLSIPIEVTP